MPPTPWHGPRKNAYTHVPRSPRRLYHASCFLEKCPERGDGQDLDGSHLLDLWPKCDCQGLASTSRPRCSRSRMKSSSNPPLRLWVKLRRTQCEHMFSALPSNPDIARRIRHVRFVPKPEVASSLRRHWHGKKTAGFQTNVPVHPGARRSRRGRRGSAVNQNENGRNTLVKVKC